MAVNAEAIHGTVPFLEPGLVPQSDVRYTTAKGKVFCIVLKSDPAAATVLLPVRLHSETVVSWLGVTGAVQWNLSHSGNGVAVTTPSGSAPAPFVIVLTHPSVPVAQAVQVLVP